MRRFVVLAWLVGMVGCGGASEGADAGPDGAREDAGGTEDGGDACGDGTIDAGEECDDGDTAIGDGCSASCLREAGFVCEGEPSVCSRGCTSSSECDDSLFCNGVETCSEGACAPGTPPELDDAIPCTDDRCDEDTDSILHVPAHEACSDGDACNGEEQCTATGCVPGAPVAIDDGIDCTTDACDPDTGAVTHTPVDSACDDGSDCTADACTPGVGCTAAFTCECTSSADCDDGNPCTDEACDSDGACQYTNNTASCDDGLYCNGADVCAAGACAHAGDPCAGGAECNRTCDESRDSCARPAGAACTDDGNGCTNDVCDGSGACTHPSNTASCDDGLFCNGADVCAGGSCTHAGDPCAGGGDCADTCDEALNRCELPAGTACADDGNGCTNDVCNGSGVCTHPANTASCDDGLFCNGADVCAGGACTHAGDPCAGGAACNTTCNEAGDHCFTPAGAACPDDGMACTTDTCDGAGVCTHVAGGAEAACGDGMDDDCDGAADCADADCAGDACGPGGATCVGTSCVCPGGTSESASCTNGVDDDCDGALDCADADCASAPACSCTRTLCTSSCAGGLTCLGGTCARGGAYGWDRTFGGASSDSAGSAVSTSSGYYVAGTFYGTFDFGGGPRTSAGSADGVLIAYTPAGSHRWDRTYGGTRADALLGIAADASGNVVVIERESTGTATNDAIVRKLDAAGTELWERRFGTDVSPSGVAVDSSGIITVVGYFFGTTDFGGGARTAAATGMGNDIFVLSLASDGGYRWDRTFDGGGTWDAGYAVAADASGNVYVGGEIGAQADFGGGPTPSYPGGAFVASFTRDGAYRWDRSFGSTQPDSVSSIAVSQLGDVVVGASFGGSVDFGGGTRTSAAFVDGVVWVLGTDGSYRWDRVYRGATDNERVDGVSVDCAGNIVATGMFTGSVDFGGGARTSAGNRDVFVVSLTRAGAYRWDRTYGGTGADRGLESVITSTGRVLVTGSFSNTANFGGASRSSAGATDAFVLELAD